MRFQIQGFTSHIVKQAKSNTGNKNSYSPRPLEAGVIHNFTNIPKKLFLGDSQSFAKILKKSFARLRDFSPVIILIGYEVLPPTKAEKMRVVGRLPDARGQGQKSRFFTQKYQKREVGWGNKNKKRRQALAIAEGASGENLSSLHGDR